MSPALTPEVANLLPLAAEGVVPSPPPVLPRKPGRNQACYCGSGKRFKRCCMERDAALRRQQRVEAQPEWLLYSERKLHQFLRYGWKVFDLPGLLGMLRDGRRDPGISTFHVVSSLFFAAVLRTPSLNALEGNLKEGDFQKLIGLPVQPGEKAFSADTISDMLDQCDVDSARNALAELIRIAERNKVFRDGSYGGKRCVAIDGWEPYCSYDRHCLGCLTRQVKGPDGTKRTQYYHRYVVAMLLGPTLDSIVAVEPVLSEEARDADPEHQGHEGELTAAYRLLDRLHETHGGFIEIVITDALYANGPWMTRLDKYGYGGIISLQKEHNEPLKEAMNLWRRGEAERQVYEDPDNRDQVIFSDVDDLQTLSTYKGKVRVIRAEVTPSTPPASESSEPSKPKSSTWCFALTGCARRLSRPTALKAMRSRWHIENTAFNQWGQYWNLEHVFRHTPAALHALFLIWMLAFNLLQFFFYCRLRRERKPRDVSDTLRHLIETMLRDLATLPAPIPWSVRRDSG
jgi:hypothetical protein